MNHLDPRTKFLTVTALIGATVCTHYVAVLMGLAVLLLISFLTVKTAWRLWGRNLLLVSWLMVYTFLMKLWGLSASAGLTWVSIQQSLLGVIQIGLMVGWGTLLGVSTSALELAAGFDAFLQPFRRLGLASSRLSTIVMLSLRFLPILHEEYQLLVKAHIARGIDFMSGTRVERIRQVIALGMPLWYNVLRRVDQLTLAMDSRAFRVQGERTGIVLSSLTCRDYLFLIGSGTLLIGTCVKF